MCWAHFHAGQAICKAIPSVSGVYFYQPLYVHICVYLDAFMFVHTGQCSAFSFDTAQFSFCRLGRRSDACRGLFL